MVGLNKTSTRNSLSLDETLASVAWSDATVGFSAGTDTRSDDFYALLFFSTQATQ